MNKKITKGILAAFLLAIITITATPSSYAHGHHGGGHGCYQRDDCPYSSRDCPYYR